MMKDSQNVFYSSISKFYSEIFPYNPLQLQFVRQQLNDMKNKQILDIGCATGELSYQLALAGAEVTGIDLNEDLLTQARLKNTHNHLTFEKMNMLELKENFSAGRFDVVLCFGNTLVHLNSNSQVQEMLHGVRSVLKPGGIFLIQILNYDYILSEKVDELPNIETENISFIRRYIFEKENRIIRFKTQLVIKNEELQVENETFLLALKSAELKLLLNKAGFNEVELFSNFKGENFGGKHLPLVIKSK